MVQRDVLRVVLRKEPDNYLGSSWRVLTGGTRYLKIRLQITHFIVSMASILTKLESIYLS